MSDERIRQAFEAGWDAAINQTDWNGETHWNVRDAWAHYAGQHAKDALPSSSSHLPSGTIRDSHGRACCSACGRTDIWADCDERSCPVHDKPVSEASPAKPETTRKDDHDQTSAQGLKRESSLPPCAEAESGTDAEVAKADGTARQVAAADNPPCYGCGGPYQFDTSVPSPLWNQVIRGGGYEDYLCTTCIVRAFAHAGVGFTATLWGAEFSGLAIDVRITEADASPMKDPIAAAVDAQLDPLKDELIKAGHKLAKEID